MCIRDRYKDEVVSLEDEYGKINFHLIPYISLNQAKVLFDDNIDNFTDLYSYLLKDKSYEGRNVLITHCYANNVGIESEDAYNEGQKPLIIGGSDAMDGHLFLNFDYVALGHLHLSLIHISEPTRPSHLSRMTSSA